MPFFKREGRDLVTPEAFFWTLLSHTWNRLVNLRLSILTGEDLHATAIAKQATSGGLVLE